MLTINKSPITIGITAFNEGRLIVEAWESVLNQTSDNWEAVMVLDGGGDQETRKYFESIQHPKLRKYSYTLNQRIYPCRTKAIEMAETEWYFQLDADDLLPSNAIDLVINVIQNNPNIEFIAGGCRHFSLGPDQIRYPQHNPEILTISPLFFAQAPITKKLFKKLGGYFIPNHFVHSDWDFWLSVYEREIKGYFIKKVIYERRRRSDSVTWQHLDEIDKSLDSIIIRHPLYFNSKNRKQRAKYNVYEKLARNYKTIGKRNKAAENAKKALKYGDFITAFSTIFQEQEMNYIRYLLRRLGRYIHWQKN